ncbi:MAG TPA: hypothetical protein VGT99_00960 [Gammaproteobacteria bacterium]|nr:hypothetical protein [Gammaproteobacteria bacterium]
MNPLFGLRYVALAAGLLSLLPVYAGNAPDRTVQGHSVISSHDPKTEIALPTAAVYVGSERWLLKAYWDDVELHAFVDAGADKHVQRLYWVQFEAYLPSHPEEKHDYDSPRHATLGGLDFFVDTWVSSPGSTDDPDPDSDSAHLKAVLRSKGYTLPASRMSVRFVHLMDDARKELMFIYSEDTGPTGYTAADLSKGGRAYAQWPGIEAGLIARGQDSIQLH